ncbi:MAG: hypothetical protein ABSG95_11435 [Solirubrobacteraceae bacterium]|jgi:hypothetical protein
MPVAPQAAHSVVDRQVTPLSATEGICALCHMPAPPDGSVLVTMSLLLSTATHSVAVGHATPVNSVAPVSGVGVVGTNPGTTCSGADHETGDAAFACPAAAEQVASVATDIKSAALLMVPGRREPIAAAD